METMRCRNFFRLTKRNNSLVLKLNSSIKHSSYRNYVAVKLRIAIGEQFISPFNIHVKDDKVFKTTWHFNIVD